MCIIIATFALHSRGSGQRRGTTLERLDADTGQYLLLEDFILRQAARDEHCLADFFYTLHWPIMINRTPISVKFS